MAISKEHEARLKTIGGRVRVARLNRGLTAEAIGRSLGVGKAAISKWENNDFVRPPERLSDFARLTQVSYEWLISAKQPPRDLDLDIADGLLVGTRPPPDGVKIPRELIEFGFGADPSRTELRREPLGGGVVGHCLVDTSVDQITQPGTFFIKFPDGGSGRAVATVVDGELTVDISHDDWRPGREKPNGDTGSQTFDIVGRLVAILKAP